MNFDLYIKVFNRITLTNDWDPYNWDETERVNGLWVDQLLGTLQRIRLDEGIIPGITIEIQQELDSNSIGG